MMNLKSFMLLVLVLLSGLAQAQEVKPIRLAVVGPQSGPVAQYGDMQRIGVEQAIRDINAAGGVNGTQLQAVYYDDACDAKQAVQIANRIVKDKIKFVIGPMCSNAALPASAVYDEEEIIMISPSSTVPELTQRNMRYVFRTIGLDKQQGPIAANYIIEHIKPQRVAIIHDKQQYSNGLAQTVRQQLTKAGVEVVVFDSINFGERDFYALIAKLKKRHVDLVYFGGYYPEMGLLIRQAAAQKYKPLFMAAEASGISNISAVAGENGEGFLMTAPREFAYLPANQKIVKHIQEAKQSADGPFVFTSYAAVKILAEALKLSKTTDTAKVAETMRRNSFVTPMGKLQFTANGDLKDFDFVVYRWHANGIKEAVVH